jgi:hypothetical protein
MTRQTEQAARDVAWLIRQTGTIAKVMRPTPAGTGSFYGSHEASETPVGEVPIEMRDLPPKDLAELGADAVAAVLPDAGIVENDFVEVAGVRYRVTDVKPQRFFGTVTHIDLHLARERRHG